MQLVLIYVVWPLLVLTWMLLFLSHRQRKRKRQLEQAERAARIAFHLGANHWSHIPGEDRAWLYEECLVPPAQGYEEKNE